MFTGVSHIEVRVQAFDACYDVYVRRLGLVERASGAAKDGRRVALLRVGPSLLELREDPSAEPARDPETGKPLNSMYDFRCWVSHFAFPMRDAHATYRQLGAKGIDWSCAPSDQAVGHHLVRRRLIEFQDPAYLLVQFAERIDEEGRSLEKEPAAGSASDEPWPGCDRIDHIMLNATDMATKRDFYAGKLGLAATVARPTRLGHQCDVTLGETLVELTTQPTVVAPLHAGAIACLGLLVEDADKAYRWLRAQGIDAAAPAAISPLPGMERRVVNFRDPDGLPLQAVQAL